MAGWLRRLVALPANRDDYPLSIALAACVHGVTLLVGAIEMPWPKPFLAAAALSMLATFAAASIGPEGRERRLGWIIHCSAGPSIVLALASILLAFVHVLAVGF